MLRRVLIYIQDRPASGSSATSSEPVGVFALRGEDAPDSVGAAFHS